MLVLTRKSHEQIQIGDNITVTILRVKGGAIRVGIEAPRNVNVLRKELEGRPARPEKNSIEAAAASTLVTVSAPSARRTAEGGASILAGGKTTATATCPANNPLRSRPVRGAAPLSGYLARS